MNTLNNIMIKNSLTQLQMHFTVTYTAFVLLCIMYYELFPSSTNQMYYIIAMNDV